MRPLIWKAALRAARTPSLWVVTTLHAVLLTLYLQVWGDGIPLANARPALDQFVFAQTVFLLAVLPWSAARCSVVRHRDDVAIGAALASRPPATVVLGACVGLALVLIAIVLSGLPFAVLAQQGSDRSLLALLAEESRLMGLGALSAVAAVAAVLHAGHPVLGWMLAMSAAVLAAAALPSGPIGALSMLSLSALLAATVAVQANRRWRYLSERPA